MMISDVLLIAAGCILGYIMCGVAWSRVRWQQFISDEAAYRDTCKLGFFRGDEETDFRVQTWMDIVSGDERLRRFPPAPRQYLPWLVSSILLWPLTLANKIITRFRKSR
jgi:hypothetical protein